MPQNFKGVQVAVVGVGKSNQALCRYLAGEGALITCFDQKTEAQLGEAYHSLSRLGVEWSLGESYLDPLPKYKHVFLTPGIKKHQPKIVEAKNNGARISSEIALFMERCKAKIAGITGSAGKTTTSTMASLMLKESLPDTEIYVGGNIGSVLIEQTDEIPKDSIVILELSSFQLQLCRKSPQVALFLNLKPNHLDIHADYNEYVEAKKNIFRFQTGTDWSFFNYDDDVVKDLANESRRRIGFFSLDPGIFECNQIESVPSAWFDGRSGNLYYCDGKNEPAVMAAQSDFLVPGKHNISNALGAILLAKQLGATKEGITRAIKAFPGVEHRIEYIGQADGIRFYNDSIATAPDRTEALLESMSDDLVLILGGYDKGLSFDELARKIVNKGCKTVLIGACADKIESAILKAQKGALTVKGQKPPARAFTLEDAVAKAVSLANEGNSIVLSPACASYDMFKDFEDRGGQFKAIVNDILNR